MHQPVPRAQKTPRPSDGLTSPPAFLGSDVHDRPSGGIVRESIGRATAHPCLQRGGVIILHLHAAPAADHAGETVVVAHPVTAWSLFFIFSCFFFVFCTSHPAATLPTLLCQGGLLAAHGHPVVVPVRELSAHRGVRGGHLHAPQRYEPGWCLCQYRGSRASVLPLP
jgi:hypothetical protein